MMKSKFNLFRSKFLRKFYLFRRRFAKHPPLNMIPGENGKVSAKSEKQPEPEPTALKQEGFAKVASVSRQGGFYRNTLPFRPPTSFSFVWQVGDNSWCKNSIIKNIEKLLIVFAPVC